MLQKYKLPSGQRLCYSKRFKSKFRFVVPIGLTCFLRSIYSHQNLDTRRICFHSMPEPAQGLIRGNIIVDLNKRPQILKPFCILQLDQLHYISPFAKRYQDTEQETTPPSTHLYDHFHLSLLHSVLRFCYQIPSKPRCCSSLLSDSE